MAKIRDYDIATFLNKDSQPEPEGGTAEINIKMISVYDLVPHPENKYDTQNGLDELADAIELNDDITPLDVKEVENNKYMIISGHKRRKAVLLLLEQSRRESNKLPCVIRKYADEDEEKAAIVFKNIQREKTEEEREMEIEMARPFIERKYKKDRATAKAEGKEFPKFRKYFADRLGVSETTIHREESYKKVADEIKEEVKAGNTTKTAVAEIASMNHTDQKAVYEAAKDESGRVSVKAIQEQKENLKKLEQEGQTTINDHIEATNESGTYKPEFTRETKVDIPPKYGTLIIKIAHDPNDRKYRAGYNYVGTNYGSGYLPNINNRPYNTEQQAFNSIISKLQSNGDEATKQGLIEAGYATDKPNVEVRNIQITDTKADNQYNQAAAKILIDLLRKELETATRDIQKSADKEEVKYITAYVEKIKRHLEIEQGAG